MARAITASPGRTDNYTLSINAAGANGQPVTVSTQVQGTISAVNVSQNPPTLTVGWTDLPDQRDPIDQQRQQ